MEKTMIVEGMSCGHCSARVKQALEAVNGVSSADVDLDSGTVQIALSGAVDDASLRQAVEDAGYDVVALS